MKHTPMLAAGVILVLIAATSGGLATPPRHDASPYSQPATDARIAALESDLAALRAELAMLMSDMRMPDATMQIDGFLKVPDIPGPSIRDGHEDEIQFVGWRWGAHNHAGDNALARDFVLFKHFDMSSPLLFQACASGKVFPEMTISFRRTIEGETSDYLVITLTEATVVSIAHGIDGQGEILTLRAGSVEMKYDDSIVAGWNFVANTPT